MIFASVGSMLPFDRLVRGVDSWAGCNPQIDTLIQIGSGSYIPRHSRFVRFLSWSEYREKLLECRLFVAHAGTGSILQAMETGRLLLMLPRDHLLGEHTTDHQMHTARDFAGRRGLRVVRDERGLHAAISAALLAGDDEARPTISTDASRELLDGVGAFLNAARPQRQRK